MNSWSLALALGLMAALDVGKPVDYTQIRPLIERKCLACHADGGVAFSFEDAQRTYDLRAAIADAVLAGRMPPWMAQSGHQVYAQDFSLSAAEKDLVSRWRDGGYLRGGKLDARRAVETQRFTARVEVPLAGTRAFLPDQEQRDDYRCFIAKWPLDHDAYVTGIGLKPGNAQISHHAIIYVAAPEFAAQFKSFVQQEGGAGYRCFGGPLPDRIATPEVRAALEKDTPGALDALTRGQFWLAHWAPGMEGYSFPADTGIRIKPGSTLIVQMHYYTGFVQAQPDGGTTVGFQYAKHVSKPAMVWPVSRGEWLQARTNQSLVVPPRQSLTVNAQHPFTGMDLYIAGASGRDVEDFEAIELHSANVHMHLIGAAGEVRLHDAQGSSQTLLKIPRYQFSWQRDFFLAQPKRLKRSELAQTQLQVSCTFDNPNDTPVYGGYGSDEEMCYDFSYLALVPKTSTRKASPP